MRIEINSRKQWSAHTRIPLTRMTSWHKPDLTNGIQSRVGNSDSWCEKVYIHHTPTANWDCNELTATFAHALQLHFNEGEALLCQECISCPILIATCPPLETLRRADTNGSNKQRCNSGRSAFRFAVGVESDLRKNTDDFRWRHPDVDRPVFSRRPCLKTCIRFSWSFKSFIWIENDVRSPGYNLCGANRSS